MVTAGASPRGWKRRQSGDPPIDTAVANELHLGWLRIQTTMPKILKSLLAAALLTAGVWCASVTPSYAKPEYAKTEGKTCTFCHVTSGKPELNAAGDYYAAHSHSLKGYTPAN